MAIDENVLLAKYRKFILKQVSRYCVSLQIATSSQYYDDLFSEASIAFLLCCRTFSLESYALNAYQHAIVKNKIRSTLRVAVWKMFNMGGYNNRKIDYDRNIVISDILSDDYDSIDDMITDEFDTDFTSIEVNDFLNVLSQKDKDLIIKLMQGYSPVEISNMWGNDHRVVNQRLKKIQRLYISQAA